MPRLAIALACGDYDRTRALADGRVGVEGAGRPEKVTIPALPEGVEVTGCPAGRTLSEMLVTGEIDALYTPRLPLPYLDGDPRVRRLFPDVRAAEESYYRQTQGLARDGIEPAGLFARETHDEPVI